MGHLANISDGCLDSPTFCDGCLMTWDCVCETKGSSDLESSLLDPSGRDFDITATTDDDAEGSSPSILDNELKSVERGRDWLQKAWLSGRGLVYPDDALKGTALSTQANFSTAKRSRPSLTVAIPTRSASLAVNPETMATVSPELISPQSFSPLITPRTSSRLCISGDESFNILDSNRVVDEHISRSQIYQELAHERDNLLARVKGLMHKIRIVESRSLNKVKELERGYNVAWNTYAAMQRTFEYVEADRDEMKTKATTLEADNTRLVARVEVLQHEIADMDCRSKELLDRELLEKNSRLETQNSIFHDDYAIQERRIKTLIEEKAQLAAEKETLQQENAAKETHVNDLMTTVSGDKVQRVQLDRDLAEAKAKNLKLEARVLELFEENAQKRTNEMSASASELVKCQHEQSDCKRASTPSQECLAQDSTREAAENSPSAPMRRSERHSKVPRDADFWQDAQKRVCDLEQQRYLHTCHIRQLKLDFANSGEELQVEMSDLR